MRLDRRAGSRPSSVPRAAAALACALILLPAAAHAQGTGTAVAPLPDLPPVPPGSLNTPAAFSDCLRRDDPTDVNDPRHPARGPGFATISSPRRFLQNAQMCAAAFGAAYIAPTYALPILASLLVILVVWTGVQIMFSGRWDVTEVISTVLLAGFPVMILSTYGGTGTGGAAVWGDESLPRLVGSLGEDFSDNMVRTAWARAQAVVQSGFRLLGTSASAEDHEEATESEDTDDPGFVEGWLQWFVYLVFFILLVAIGLLPMLVAYFSYLWGYLSLIVATLVGPVFVPWILLPQTNFIFWGWLRALVSSTVQLMVGGAVFALVVSLMIAPFERYVNRLDQMQRTTGDQSLPGMLLDGGSMIFELLPLAVVSWLAAGKVSELTGMILSGGSMPSSGLSGRAEALQSNVRKAGTAGLGAAHGAARGYGYARDRGRAVMSVFTRGGGK